MYSLTNQIIPDILKRMSNPSAFNQKSFPEEIKADINAPWNLNLKDPTNFVNPIKDLANNVVEVLNYIEANCNTVYANLSSITESVISIEDELNEYFLHTERLSGQIQPGSDPAIDDSDTPREVPYLSIIANITQIQLYIAYVQNNVVGAYEDVLANNYTGILIQDELNEYLSIFENDLITIKNSIGLVGQNLESNLTAGQISTISSNVSGYGTFLNSIRTNDESDYANSVSLIDTQTDNFMQIIVDVQNQIIQNTVNSINTSFTIT